MKKTGYLLLTVLNWSLAFGAVAPAAVPIAEVPGRIDEFLLNEDVGRFTIKWRNRGYSAVDNPLTQAVYGIAGVTGVTAVSTTVTDCGFTGIVCIANQFSFEKLIVSGLLAVPLLAVTAWKWDTKHKNVRNAPNVKGELKSLIEGILLNTAHTARATTWSQTQNDLDIFLRFALAKYKSHYRASSKFDMDSFKSELENWKP